MNKEDYIVITGAIGFIGSCMVSYLNNTGYYNLILVDNFTKHTNNINGKKYLTLIDREYFFEWFETTPVTIKHIFHFGACSNTREMDFSVHEKWNFKYSQRIWNLCCEKNINLIYASSAATYGDGEYGYSDNIFEELNPLNPYGLSKHLFDVWVLAQDKTPPVWAGLKFFNVYGPNEYHKGSMASVIMHLHKQLNDNSIKLFKSHKEGIEHGEQKRDFVYVKDIIKVCYWLINNNVTGIFNVGSGKASSFKDVANFLLKNKNVSKPIEYVDMPSDIRDKYQYFTEANMDKLYNAGYNDEFYSLDKGISDYLYYLDNNLHY